MGRREGEGESRWNGNGERIYDMYISAQEMTQTQRAVKTTQEGAGSEMSV